MRTRWDSLPEEARGTVQFECGPIVKARTVSQGITRGVASRLDTESASFFLKGAPLDDRSLRLYTRERWVNSLLPPGVAAPRMLWTGDVGGWRLLLFEFISGREADLSPDSPDVPLIAKMIGTLADSLTPCPDPVLPSVAENVGFLVSKAEALLSEPAASFSDADLCAEALHRLCIDDLAGNTLLHADLKEDNILIAGEQAKVVDWALACQGAPWVEVALLMPWLIGAGHTPRQAESLAAQMPAWSDAPEHSITGLAAAWTLFREYMAHHGPVSLRQQRAESAAIGKAWLMHRMS